jgi:periplasmic protein TonB
MDQPLHDLRPFKPGRAPAHRFVSIGFVALLHVVAIWALATGLIQDLASKLPQEFKAEVIPPKEQVKPPPPPPPPDLQKPPPPFVPPPEINIQTESTAPTITTQSKVASLPPPPKVVVAPPKPAGISAPVSLKSSHNCAERFYPPIAVRLNQQGTTTLRITVSASGQVTDAKIANSSGFDSLDQASLKCVQSGSWGGYKPAMQNGQAIDAQTEVAIQWKLQ